MNALICPSPYSLTRVAGGVAGVEEAAYVREHAAGCAVCREELAALAAQGPTESWDRVLGAPGPLPDAAWRAVSEALQLPPVRLRCRIESGRSQNGGEPITSGNWLEVASGEAELVPLGGGATRGASAPNVPVASRLRLGAFEALIRRGPGRLTVALTRNGDPAVAQGIRLTSCAAGPGNITSDAGGQSSAGTGCPDSPAAFAVLTDPDGIAVFSRLAAGDYFLELEGLNP